MTKNFWSLCLVPSQQIHAAKTHNDERKCSRSVLRLLTPSQLCDSDQVTCLPCASDASSGKGASHRMKLHNICDALVWVTTH